MESNFEIISTESAIDNTAKLLIDDLQGFTVWLLFGDMGAGKTTLVRHIASQLGIEGVANSPTFSLVNEYKTKSGKVIFHFDLYRLNSINEALDIGIDEYLLSGDLCIIEWPEKIEEMWPNKRVDIHIETINTFQRKLTVSKIDI